MPAKYMSLPEQIARTAQLDAIRLQRRLTGPEQAEADRLAHRAYMREWHRTQRETEQRLARKGRKEPGHAAA